MNARKLRYRGEGDRAAVVEGVRAILDAWQRAWALEARPLAHRVAPVETLLDDGGSSWNTLGSDGDGLLAGFYRVLPIDHAGGALAADAVALAQRWLGLPSPGVQPRDQDRPPLGVRLAQRAHDALLRAMAGKVGCAAVQDLPAGDAPRACLRPFSGALRVCTSGAGATLEWLFPAAAVDRLSPLPGPSAARARAPVASIVEALAQRRLTVGVEIDPVMLTLGELASLRAGDVVTLGHRLDAPLSVVDGSGNALFGGFLVARDGAKSLKLHAESTR